MKFQISSSSSTSTSDLAISSNCNYNEKAWCLVSTLLSLRRPASPEELSGRCFMFRATPEFVRLLCSIPNSPLCLIGNNLVGLSMSVFVSFGEFFARSMRPKVELGVFGGERVLRGCGDLAITYFRKRKRSDNEIFPVLKKRAVLRSVHENMPEIASSSAAPIFINSWCEGVDLQSANPSTSLNALSVVNPVVISDMVATPYMASSNIGLLDYQLNVDNQESRKGQNTSVVNDVDKYLAMIEHQDECFANEASSDLPLYCNNISKASLLEKVAELFAVMQGTGHDLTNMKGRMDNDDPLCVDLNEPDKNTLVDPTAVLNAADNVRHSQLCETKMFDLNVQPLMDTDGPEEERVENTTVGACTDAFPSVNELCQINTDIVVSTPLKVELTNIKSTNLPLASAGPPSKAQKSNVKSLVQIVSQGELKQKQSTPSKLVQHNKADIIHKDRRGQNHRIVMAMMDKSKPISKNNASIQERYDNVHKSSKDQQKSKFPEFEPYTVEEEEGSGGYGTVYRARRKSDGLTFAIKCPHENAHKHHVKNELKMLERFGGKNYVIKFEGSLKSENSDCFVLEHVEHDRPEVLKKEIDIYQLQLYGYCMFRALVSLHKQGVYHRDIKPGNFLFSRKTQRGYLIDFNLAKDMNQKHGNIENSQPSNVTGDQQIPSAHSNSTSPNRRKKIVGAISSQLFKAGTNSALERKALKEKDLDKVKAYKDLGCCNSLTSQGADGSGVTSMRDMTSTRAPSGEKLRKLQPLYCKGRKELFSLAQKAMQSPNLGAAKAPVSNRKRVAASPGITDKKLIYPTPIPLHSSGVAISGAGSLKIKGEVKPVREGPSAGTKGFRAPEVLLRSMHQGPKIDVWSSGVTLLYLISGRMPFNGDPEQNLKDIVNMKGNEELWEVAKLHNRESSLPVELLDIRYLHSMTIKDWYRKYTKRKDLLEVIPDSLFDLLEKCLTVSPRLRITADEALNHDFFAPVHDNMLKYRSLRRGQSEDSKSNPLPLFCDSVKPTKENFVAPVNF